MLQKFAMAPALRSVPAIVLAALGPGAAAEQFSWQVSGGGAEGDYVEDESYDLATTWFFKRGVAIEFRVARTESEIGFLERNVDSAEIRFLGRL